MINNIDSLINDTEDAIFNSLGVRFRGYQRHVFRELLEVVYNESRNIVIVSMPTGSGKTLIEIGVGVWAFGKGYRVLVLEPTRFLCDQMFRRFWSRIFRDTATKEYEGSCEGFHDKSRKVVVSTPQTALKCVNTHDFDIIVVDEVHHMFGNKIYIDLLSILRPTMVFGFTALLPSRKKVMWSDTLKHLGEPRFLDYDFKKLSELGGFDPPRAVVDIYDAEFSRLEDSVYALLWTGRSIDADSKEIALLRLTLSKYGKVAFCETLYKLSSKWFKSIPKEFEILCQSRELSHKARIVLEVLGVFDVDVLKPVIVFTSRKATAYEIAKGISEVLKIPSSMIAVLTGDVGRDKRENIVESVKRGDIVVVVSTRVGEEGIDIPEAGLLIMCDIPRSELRFYQRLGRLIRLSSPSKLKYLVLVLTPKTDEYQSLEEVLVNLYAEGVDVSYILVNIAEKGVEKRVVEVVEKFVHIYNDATIPLTLITWSQKDLDPIAMLEKLISEDKNCRDTLVKIYKVLYSREPRDEELYSLLPMISTISAIKFVLPPDVEHDFEKLRSRLTKLAEGSAFVRDLEKAIELGEILYIYSIDKSSSLIAKMYQRLYKNCLEEKRYYVCDIRGAIRFDYKWVTKLLMELFPKQNLGIIIEKLSNTTDSWNRKLSEALKFDLWTDLNTNKINKSIVAKLYITLKNTSISHFTIGILFNYYNMYKTYTDKPQQIGTLIKLNLKAIGLATLEKFLEQED